MDGSRVDLLPLAAANADHLATYALMDISLDPFPYAGTTTTCESLYMGVPVITLAGTGLHPVLLVLTISVSCTWAAPCCRLTCSKEHSISQHVHQIQAIVLLPVGFERDGLGLRCLTFNQFFEHLGG